jgi:hypothetical protein
VWFQPAGWRPADVEAELPKKAVNLAEFEKLDPKIRGVRRDYVLGQFFVLIGLALFAADVFARNGAQEVLLPCFLLWPHLYTLGPPNKSLPYAARFELFRLVVVVPIEIYAMSETLFVLAPTIMLLAAAYSLGSAL